MDPTQDRDMMLTAVSTVVNLRVPYNDDILDSDPLGE